MVHNIKKIIYMFHDIRGAMCVVEIEDGRICLADWGNKIPTKVAKNLEEDFVRIPISHIYEKFKRYHNRPPNNQEKKDIKEAHKFSDKWCNIVISFDSGNPGLYPNLNVHHN